MRDDPFENSRKDFDSIKGCCRSADLLETSSITGFLNHPKRLPPFRGGGGSCGSCGSTMWIWLWIIAHSRQQPLQARQDHDCAPEQARLSAQKDGCQHRLRQTGVTTASHREGFPRSPIKSDKRHQDSPTNRGDQPHRLRQTGVTTASQRGISKIADKVRQTTSRLSDKQG